MALPSGMFVAEKPSGIAISALPILNRWFIQWIWCRWKSCICSPLISGMIIIISTASITTICSPRLRAHRGGNNCLLLRGNSTRASCSEEWRCASSPQWCLASQGLLWYKCITISPRLHFRMPRSGAFLDDFLSMRRLLVATGDRLDITR